MACTGSSARAWNCLLSSSVIDDHPSTSPAYSVAMRTGRPGAALGVRSSFADLGATLAENFGVEGLAAGKSFLADLPA